MHRVNLSHAQLEKYLSFLARGGLLTVSGAGCLTTEKGRSFIEAYERFLSLIEDIPETGPYHVERRGGLVHR